MNGRRASKQKRRIVVVIEGEQYDNLGRVAQAMNGVKWCEGDNTAESVFNEFVWHWDGVMLNSPAEISESVLGGIATGEDGGDAPEPLHTERLKELKAAFSVFDKRIQVFNEFGVIITIDFVESVAFSCENARYVIPLCFVGIAFHDHVYYVSEIIFFH